MEVLHPSNTSFTIRAITIDARSSTPKLEGGVAFSYTSWLLHRLEFLISLIPEMTLIILFGLVKDRLTMISNRVQVSMQKLLSPLVTDALSTCCRA